MMCKSLMLAALLTAGITVQGQEVTISWQNDAATVTVSDDILSLVKVKVSGADVSVEQDASVAQEITYRLAGQSDNGSFVHKGDFKITLSLEGLQLSSRTGTAMQIKNGKRIALVLKDGTENMLTDAENGSQKGCMIVKGHSEFQGGGTLTINGRSKHAYKGDEYVELKASLGTLNINSTVKDGIHIDDYFEMKGGVLNITTTGGGYWDDEDLETKAPSCINTATYAVIHDGKINLLSTGSGGKGIKCDSTFTMNGGTLTARTTGARYIYENYDGDPADIDAIPDSLKNSPKAVKADMGICINGGTLRLFTEQDGGEGLESKDTLTISGGDIHIETYDDCINAAGNIRIIGGNLFLNSLDNDGIDTNQSMYINGGNIVTLGNYLHELGIDVNDKSPYKKLYLTGGTIVCMGGTSQISHPYTCNDAQPALYYKGKLEAGVKLLLRCTTDNEDIIRYQLDRDYTAEAGGEAPDLCLMLSSPLLQKGKDYELMDEASQRVLASVNSLDSLYSYMIPNNGLDDLFDSDSFTYNEIMLPYRRINIHPSSPTRSALLIYLHEAPSRGSDNVTQLQEVSVDSIYRYLAKRYIPAIVVVPQCPAGQGWSGRIRRAVYELAKSYISAGKADRNRIYIVGNSIGGTGTWCQLSNYPGFYAAAMPIAGNPSGYDAANVATTPVYTVMGTEDTVMPLSNVETFLSEVIAAGGTIKLDVGEGWDHVATCDHSFTEERLDWLFSQARSSSSGIKKVEGSKPINDKYFDLSGRQVCSPTRGIYIQNGKTIVIR
jgi:hypothetical protein